jgi:hypothetical protein
MEFELKASHLLGRLCTTWATLLTLEYSWVILLIVVFVSGHSNRDSQVYPRAGYAISR